jgi:hypothetical protein
MDRGFATSKRTGLTDGSCRRADPVPRGHSVPSAETIAPALTGFAPSICFCATPLLCA